MNFATHVKTIADKADELSALSQILPNVDGPKASKRKLLCSLVESIILYAAPIWESTVDHEKGKATDSR